MINNKNNAVFDIIFSLVSKTLHEVVSKLVILFLVLVSSKFWYNFVVLIVILATGGEDSFILQEKFAF